MILGSTSLFLVEQVATVVGSLKNASSTNLAAASAFIAPTRSSHWPLLGFLENDGSFWGGGGGHHIKKMSQNDGYGPTRRDFGGGG